MKRTELKRSGFTIVELLTVMGVIAVLIGLLVPALNMVKDFSREIQQRAQFHSIDVGLELFKNDFGIYPESNDNSRAPQPNLFDNRIYCGANKLAEALVGWDLLGFHPKSGFTATGFNDLDGVGASTPVLIYDPINGIDRAPLYVETYQQNIDNRKKYIELEHANAFKMEDIYRTYGSFLPGNFALCDVFAKKRQSGKKTGMPILYYRARTAFKFQDYDPATDDDSATNNDVYNFWDNASLLALGDADQGIVVRHPLNMATPPNADDLLLFEEIILNKQVQAATRTATVPDGIKRPYRNDSYILISAGKDGLYGTSDDLYNFMKEKQ